MALYFRGNIPGIHQEAKPGPPELHVQRTKYFGLLGVSEIVGYRGGRPIEYRITVRDPAIRSAAAMVLFLQDLDNQVGVNDVLTESGTISRVFRDCTFEGFTIETGPLPDVAGTLGTAGGWFVVGTLRWYQLVVV